VPMGGNASTQSLCAMADHNVKIFLMRGIASHAARAAAIAVTTKLAAYQKTLCVMERKTVWMALMNLTVVGVSDTDYFN